MNGDSRGLACSYCDEAFKRKEHLDRHIRRHLGSKPFQCTVCLKAFSRKDVLNRHLTTHELNTANLSSPRRPGKKPQACLSCSRAKQRCSKDNPCRSCASKGRICRYPTDGAASDGVTTPAGQSDGSETPAVDAGEQRTLPDASSRATAPMPTNPEYGRLVPLNELETNLNADVIPMSNYSVRTAAASVGQAMNAVSEFGTFSASMHPIRTENTQAWNSAFASFNQPFP
ncbi:hypothetical protein CcaCcLH18_07367 [Colletotrichum camelliae]|nr:hypothetical protein CcaCcLH18_07367 [Colletotrichum camelliae]